MMRGTVDKPEITVEDLLANENFMDEVQCGIGPGTPLPPMTGVFDFREPDNPATFSKEVEHNLKQIQKAQEKYIKKMNDAQLRDYEETYDISYRYVIEPRFEGEGCELTYHPIGVVAVVSFQREGTAVVYIRAGWSLCNLKKDQFNKATGKYYAVKMALDSMTAIPSMDKVPARKLNDVKYIMNTLLKDVLFNTLTSKEFTTLSVGKEI